MEAATGPTSPSFVTVKAAFTLGASIGSEKVTVTSSVGWAMPVGEKVSTVGGVVSSSVSCARACPAKSAKTSASAMRVIAPLRDTSAMFVVIKVPTACPPTGGVVP